jgi:hypothetical protein
MHFENLTLATAIVKSAFVTPGELPWDSKVTRGGSPRPPGHWPSERQNFLP